MLDRRQLAAANDAFYRAFERADPVAMDAVWALSPADVCVHPGWDATRGSINVANTWRRLFASGERLAFALSDLHAEVYGDVGIVHCVENIRVAGSGQPVGRVAATNVFRRIDGAWKMIVHHGSPVSGAPEEFPAGGDELEN